MDYILKSSVLLVLMYLGYILFLKRETFFNHNRWFLLLGLVTAFILPLIYIPEYIYIEETPITNVPINYNFIPAEVTPQDQAFDWVALLSTIYFIGLIIFLIQFLLQFGSLAYLLLRNAKNKEGIYTYVVVKNKISPFSFFKWIVYNPNLYNNKELQLILNHERVHARQWHSADIICSRLACVIFWFNPLVWLYHKDIEQNLEYIADNEAQNQADSEKNYQHLLLKTSVGNTNINLTSNFYNSLIKKRIVMLQKNRSQSINRWKSLFILPFLILFLMSVNRKEIYEYIDIEPTSEIYEQSQPEETIEILFYATTTDTEFKSAETKLKAHDIILDLKTIKRNSKGKITQIHIEFTDKTTNNSTNYKVNDTNGITPFYFKKSKNGALSVGNVEVIEVVEEVIEEDELEEEDEEVDDIIIETPNSEKKKEKKLIIKKGEKTKIVARGNVVGKIQKNGNTITADSIYVIKGYTGKDPIYIVNGKRVEKKDLIEHDVKTIENVNVLKGKSAITIYGNDGKNGVVEIITKDGKGKNSWTYKTSDSITTIGNTDKNNWQISKLEAKAYRLPESTEQEVNTFISSGKKPLIIVNNEVLGKIDIKGFDHNIIESMSVLKGKNAIQLYGDKGKDGAIIIVTKDDKERLKRLKNTDTRVVVGSVSYDDDDNTTMMLHYITKNMTDNLMQMHKKELATKGITVKYSKLKRNDAGEITRLKVSLSDNEGNKSSATFQSDNGIPQITIGKKGDALIASSSYPF